EKAHPDVFNILLQVLDDGQITDSQGRRVSFKNSVIIMTSNCGAERIMSPKRLGFGDREDAAADYKYMKDQVMEEVKRTFKPEFLNRIDEMIVFHPLEKSQMGEILDILLKDITKRLQSQLGIQLKVAKDAKDVLIEAGYDPKFGARPLKRAIQTLMEDPLAEEFLVGKIRENSVVTARKADKKLKFTSKAEKKS
ncbi:MAG: ATP-dependent Clp protease ATP-binding subunit, partial [Parasporobacterium sp.]|nr:ATP-dependent Clp protease ATP-binding subunit [Parasporobacterium sp.]